MEHCISFWTNSQRMQSVTDICFSIDRTELIIWDEHAGASIGIGSFEGDSVQTRAMCPTSLSSPVADDRNGRKYVFRSCFLAFVPGRFRFSSRRNGRRSTKCHANSSHFSFPVLAPAGISVIQKVVPIAPLEAFGSASPFLVRGGFGEGEFPGQETRNRYRLRNRGLRITDPTDPPLNPYLPL